jgi:hypothetical protein
VTIALLAALTLDACSGESAPSPSSASSSSVDSPLPTEAPTATPEVKTFAEQVALHEIKTGQSPTDLSKNFVSELSNWNSAGTDTAVAAWVAAARKSGDASDAALAKFVHDYAVEQAKVYGTALIGPDYATSTAPGVQGFLNSYTTVDAGVIEDMIRTTSETTPYTRYSTFGELKRGSKSSSATSVVFTFKESDNAGQGNDTPVNSTLLRTNTDSVTFTDTTYGTAVMTSINQG